jgi:hypothetical protein
VGVAGAEEVAPVAREKKFLALSVAVGWGLDAPGVPGTEFSR